jgi:hypothetical protein
MPGQSALTDRSRWTARLLITAASESTAEDEELLFRLCDIYKTGNFPGFALQYFSNIDSRIIDPG